MPDPVEATRSAFEKHFSNPPFEFPMERQTEEGAFPGNYRSYVTECAWEGWQAALILNPLDQDPK